jgi:hypothetical protein
VFARGIGSLYDIALDPRGTGSLMRMELNWSIAELGSLEDRVCVDSSYWGGKSYGSGGEEPSCCCIALLADISILQNGSSQRHIAKINMWIHTSNNVVVAGAKVCVLVQDGIQAR